MDAIKEITESDRTQTQGLTRLKKFDTRQLFRLFVDGQHQKKYQGWKGYEKNEPHSLRAILNGLCLVLKNFDIRSGLRSAYLIDLHRTCMLHVQSRVESTSPGDFRFTPSLSPLNKGKATLENIHELLELRTGDDTIVFGTPGFRKRAENLNAEEVFNAIQEKGFVDYRSWYPLLDPDQRQARDKQKSVVHFYVVKHYIQMCYALKVDAIVETFNDRMRSATSDTERLAQIAWVTRNLKLLHPFPDGNTRTISCLLLNQLLMNHGFDPVLLYNPNLDCQCSLAQWTQELQKGMAAFNTLLNNPEDELYGLRISDLTDEEHAYFLRSASELIGLLQSGP